MPPRKNAKKTNEPAVVPEKKSVRNKTNGKSDTEVGLDSTEDKLSAKPKKVSSRNISKKNYEEIDDIPEKKTVKNKRKGKNDTEIDSDNTEEKVSAKSKKVSSRSANKKIDEEIDVVPEEKSVKNKRKGKNDTEISSGSTEVKLPAKSKKVSSRSVGKKNYEEIDDVPEKKTVKNKRKGKIDTEIGSENTEDKLPAKSRKVSSRSVSKKTYEEIGDVPEKKTIKNKRKGKNDTEMDSDSTEDKLPAKSKKVSSRSVTKANDEEPDVISEKKSTKRKGKSDPEIEPSTKLKKETEVKVSKEPKQKVLKNKTANDFETIDFSCTRLNEDGQEMNLKIASWNVDGIRAWHNKSCLQYIEYEKPDIFCIQETKSTYDKLPDEIKSYKGYHQYWCSANKEGYSGVGLLTKKMPINVINGIDDTEHDAEGRIITAEFEKFYVVCVYVPNSGRGLVTLQKRMDWNEKFKRFINNLNASKPIIICGDMNVAHQEIDLKNPKTNKKTAGFTQEERDGMTDFISNGYVDSYRKLYPTKEQVYTFWTYMSNSRAKNTGWRIDYFLISNRLMPKVCDHLVRSSVYGSDHCPIVLCMNI